MLKNILTSFLCVLFLSVLPDRSSAVKIKSPLPSAQNSPSGERLEPASQTREKNELQHLNHRFASYIDRVRKLEDENRKLKNDAR